MSRPTALSFVIAALALVTLAACASPPPRDGAGKPVDPHTGVEQGGTSSPN